MKLAKQSTAVIKLHPTTTRDRSTSTSSQDHRVNIVVVGSPSLHLRCKIRASSSQDLHVGTIIVDASRRISSSPRRRRIFITSSSQHLRRRVNHGTGVTGTPNCSCRAHTLYSLATRSGLRVSVIHTPIPWLTSGRRLLVQLVDIRQSSSTADHLRFVVACGVPDTSTEFVM